MSLRINDTAPNFTANTTQGEINFHEWIGDGWAILFSHPKDFTPVCTTELGYVARLSGEFTKRNCKVIGLSVDPVENHGKWAKDIEETQGYAVEYPMIGDPMITYPMSVGRNFAEILRALDAVQKTEGKPIATPADWVPGQDVIVGLALDDEAAKAKFGELDIRFPYLRFTKDPG